jgi:L-serine/L-threonine ammonia-lyase
MADLHVVSPLIESVPLKTLAGGGCDVLLKLDCTQPSGSYKLRGMGFKGKLAVARGRRHFVASSGGNAGLAVAWAARALGVKATVVVPESTPPMARAAIAALGAAVEVHGSVYAEADGLAREMAAASPEGIEYFSAYDDPELWRAGLLTQGPRASHRTPSHRVEDPLGHLQIGKAPQETRPHI